MGALLLSILTPLVTEEGNRVLMHLSTKNRDTVFCRKTQGLGEVMEGEQEGLGMWDDWARGIPYVTFYCVFQ